VRAVAGTRVNRDDEGKAEGTDYNCETKCLEATSANEATRRKGTLANTNFVTISEGTLRLKGIVDDVAANVKHSWKE